MQFVADAKPITLWEDNQSTIHLTRGHTLHKASKHIAIRHFYIRECCQNGLLVLSKVASAENVADLCTKSTSKKIFEYLRDKLMVPYEEPVNSTKD